MQGGGPAPVGFRRDGGRGRSATRECARQRRSARQTDKPAGVSLAFFPHLPRLPPSVCLSFHLSPSTFPFLFSLSQCQVSSAVRAYIIQAHALTRTHTSRAELGYNLPSHFPRRHHLPCTTSQTHPPLTPGGCCLGVEPLLTSPSCPHPSHCLFSWGFWVKTQRLKGPRAHPARLLS